MAAPTTDILGFRVSRLSLDEHGDWLKYRMQGSQPTWVVTLNFEMIARQFKNRAYGELIGEADLMTADGAPILWLSRLTRRRIPARTTGIDLVARLLAAVNPAQVAVIGGTQVHRLEQARNLSGSLGYIDDQIIPDREPAWVELSASIIRRRKIRLVLLALGVPKQDHIAEMLRAALTGEGVVLIGIGGAIDVAIGDRYRAPTIMQRLGMEWLYRLTREPRRLWRRYLLLYPYGLLRILPWVLRRVGARLVSLVRHRRDDQPLDDQELTQHMR